MLVRHLITAFLATLSLIFSYQATKALTHYIFDEVFDTATDFDKCNFDNTNFEPTTGFDLYEDILNAFDSVQSEPAETTPNAANLLGDAPSSSSDFDPPPSSSSDAPGASPSPSPDSPPPPPQESAKSTTGHSGSTHGIGVVSATLITAIMVVRSCWFKRRPLPSPVPPPPLLSPPPPRPPPSSLPSQATPPPPVSAPPNPSAAPAPAPAVMERLALVAAPARQVAGARRKSRRAKKRG